MPLEAGQELRDACSALELYGYINLLKLNTPLTISAFA